MKILPAMLLLALGVSSAAADVQIFNVTHSKMKVDVTFPNGKVESSTLDAAEDSADDEKWTVGFGVKTLKVSISDDSGTPVWHGVVDANAVGVIVPSAKGPTYVAAGTYGGSDSWRAAPLMNITGDSITVDLEGRNGLASHRNIATGPAFDLKKPDVLDPRESTFGVTLKVKGVDKPIELESTGLTPAAYYVIWKRSRDGGYRLLRLGNLPPASKPAAAKPTRKPTKKK